MLKNTVPAKLMFGKQPHAKRGLGKNVEAWWCLEGAWSASKGSFISKAIPPCSSSNAVFQACCGTCLQLRIHLLEMNERPAASVHFLLCRRLRHAKKWWSKSLDHSFHKRGVPLCFSVALMHLHTRTKLSLEPYWPSERGWGSYTIQLENLRTFRPAQLGI